MNRLTRPESFHRYEILASRDDWRSGRAWFLVDTAARRAEALKLLQVQTRLGVAAYIFDRRTAHVTTNKTCDDPTTRGDHCHVADSACLAPAGYGIAGVGFSDSDKLTTGVCVQCGEPTCGNCSERRTIHGRRGRYCNDCQIENDGDDQRVMDRLARLVEQA